MNTEILTEKDQESIDRRRDIRTLPEFIADIANYTANEQVGIRIIDRHITDRGVHFSFQDFGMDNKGGLITDAKKVNANPDFLCKIGTKTVPVEVKVHPDKFTFSF